jgi:hypothetical protein
VKNNTLFIEVINNNNNADNNNNTANNNSTKFKFIHLLTQQPKSQLKKEHKYVLREKS